jgi:spermidine synthase
LPEWFDEVFHDRVRFGLKIERRVHSERTPFQQIDVFDTEQFGRVLALDRILQTSESDEHLYHEMLVQPAMVTAESVRRVLVIGGGDGGTVREVLRHPEVERVVMVEIDRRVVEVCREHLPAVGTAWDDPRLEVRIGDGVAHVREAAADAYDVAILDGSDPVGPSRGLFDHEFYRNVCRCLRPGGTFGLQSEPPAFYREVFLEIQRALAATFDTVAPYFGPVPLYSAGNMSWTLAGDGINPSVIRPERLACLDGACRYFTAEIHHAAFAQPAEIRDALARTGKDVPAPG